MYPVELCLKFNLNNSIWIKYLAVDALFCHTVLWASQAYFDGVRGVTSSCVQIRHAHKMLKMLQQRLADGRLATSDCTICAVTGLTMTSALVGEYDAARKHMMGLFKMVELRGGVRAFEENMQIQLKICRFVSRLIYLNSELIRLRADLTIAMLTKKKPMFFSDDISWKPYGKVQSNSRESLPEYFTGVETHLCSIWTDLQEFTKSACLAFQTGHKMDGALFQEMLISVQYRLLLLEVSADSIDEAIHVGTLAFSTNIFLQTRGLAIRFETLFAKLRACIIELSSLEESSETEFKLWLLFVARMFIGREVEYSWLELEMRKCLEALNLTSWNTVRERLQGYLWIGILHDTGGKRAFEDAFACSS